MLIGHLGNFSAAGRTHQVTFLNKKRFINLFDGSGFFGNSGGDGGNANGAAFKLVDDGTQNAVVHFIQPVAIHVQGF